MKSSAARLLDKVGAAGLLTGHVGASPWPARVSGSAVSSWGGRTGVGDGGGSELGFSWTREEARRSTGGAGRRPRRRLGHAGHAALCLAA